MTRHARTWAVLGGVGAALCLAAATMLADCSPPVRGNGLNVVLVTIETTRADHLGAYGYSRPTSPSFDAFAREGVLFERATTVSPRTNPSLASTMTARYPHEHGVRNLLLPLEPENRTLAEALHDAGYQTIAVQTHPRLVRTSGFEQGFETYDDAIAEHPLAEDSFAAAAGWIERVADRGRPWFVWLHVMDPHWTYDPKPPWRTLFGPDDPRPAALYRALAERRATIGPVIFQNTMPPDEVDAFVRLYDSEIRYTDDALGGFLRRFRDRGLMDRTIVVVTSDHGESLGEHRYFFEHGDLGTEPEIHVPLAMQVPASRWPPGIRIRPTVRSIDVAPTILDLLGLPAEAAFRGESLVPVIEGREGDRPCLGETDKKMHEENDRREVEGTAGKWRWLKRGSFKLMLIPRAGGRIDTPLYDLDRDPGESIDVFTSHPDMGAAMLRELKSWAAEDRRPEREYHVTEEARDILRSLGYVN